MCHAPWKTTQGFHDYLCVIISFCWVWKVTDFKILFIIVALKNSGSLISLSWPIMLLVSRNNFSQGFVYEIQINMLIPYETWRTKNMTITFYLLNNIYHISSNFFLWIEFVCTHVLLCSSGHCRERHWCYLCLMREEITA